MDAQTATAAKTERLTLLLSREDKRLIEQRAQAANLSVGEFMRRAGQSYEPDLDYDTLEAVVKTWQDNLTHMRSRLAEAFARFDEYKAEMNELRKGRDGLG